MTSHAIAPETDLPMQKEEKEGGRYAWTLNALIFFEMIGSDSMAMPTGFWKG